MRRLVYTTLTKKSAWPKEWSEHEEFREHWQEFKQLMGKDLPGKYLATKLNHELVIVVIGIKNEHDHYNFSKCIATLKIDYPARSFVNLSELN
jgi:hypothetical protein